MKPLVVLWVGGGQDSTALLYLLIHDGNFREKYIGDADIICIMSDTGNEYPETYLYVETLKKASLKNNIPFYFIKASMGYHSQAWQSLQGQFERNDRVMSVAFPKTCTSNLKINVCYNFLQDYIKSKYGFESKGKRVFYEYEKHFGKIRTIIGFAKGEENRRAVKPQVEMFPELIKENRPVWMRKNVEHIYPLIDLGLDRKGCQNLIEGFGYEVPMPSNCMFCPFQNEAEIVYLHRFYPAKWAEWVAYEANKLKKDAGIKNNLGVKGNKTLSQFLEAALVKYGSWTDEKLKDYKFSHGHCVKSKY